MSLNIQLKPCAPIDQLIVTFQMIERSGRLSSVPAPIEGMARAVQGQHTTDRALECVLGADSALCETLLRLANLPYFSGQHHLGSVREAMIFLGSEKTFELTITAWLCENLPQEIALYHFNAKSFWLHAVATAILAEQLALHFCLFLPNHAFAAGLLHDVGKLVIGVSQEKSAPTSALREAASVMTEQLVLHTDHTIVGSLVCHTWSLPDALSSVARSHHHPGLNPIAPHQPLVDVVHLADWLAHSLGFGASVRDRHQAPHRDALERLSVAEYEIGQIANDALLSQIWDMGELVQGGLSC